METIQVGNRTYTLTQFENAGISYLPCNGGDAPLIKYAHLWDREQPFGIKDWSRSPWEQAELARNLTGLRLVTGKPSSRLITNPNTTAKRYYLAVADIEPHLVNQHPHIAAQIERTYRQACEGTPCIVASRSGGRHYYAWIPFYHNAGTFQLKEHTGNHDDGTPFYVNLLDILTRRASARVNPQYEILQGDLLNIPLLPRQTMAEICYLVMPIAAKVAGAKPRVIVETSQVENLDIEWDADSKSQYFPAAHCRATSHRDEQRATVRFQKRKDGSVTGKCFNCGETWFEIAPNLRGTHTHAPEPIEWLPDASPLYTLAEEARGPSFRYFTREERQLIRAIGLDPDAGWHNGTPHWIPKYAKLHAATGHFARNGQPPEVEKRRVWATHFKPCPNCGEAKAFLAIVRYELKAVYYCDACHQETRVTSYAELEWKRKPANAIQSNFQGFIGEDPDIAALPIGEPSTLTHIGAPMGTGKTWYYEHVIAPALTARYPDITLVVVAARVTQVIAKYSESCQGSAEHDAPRCDAGEGRKWGAFCQQTTPNDKFIGTNGAITTPNSLPQVLKAIARAGKDPAEIHLCFDESDFDMSLLNAAISKAQAREIKSIITQSIARYGAVTMGQTEQTLTLEAFAAEFGVATDALFGYYKTGNIQSATCNMYEVPEVEGKRRLQVAAAWENILDRLEKGIPCYVFCKRRATAKALAALHPDALLYDRYHRGRNANQAMIHKQRSDAPLTLFTPTVDVALNIKHPCSAVFVLTDDNDRTGAGLDTTVQQAMRVRDAAEYHVFLTRYNNALPVSPLEREGYEEAHAKARLDTDEGYPSSLVQHLSHREALKELNGNEPREYITHQLEQVGFHVARLPCPTPKKQTIALLADMTKAQRAEEKEAVKARAREILENDDVMAAVDIQRRSSQGTLKPQPIEPLAHETALAACLAVGYEPITEQEERELQRTHRRNVAERARWDDDDDVENLDDRIPSLAPIQKRHAADFITAEINPEDFRRWRRGYLGTHHPHLARKEWEDATELMEEVTHRPDARRIGNLVKSLLQELPRGSVTETEWARAAVTALKGHVKALKDGELGAHNARKVRFVNLTTPNPALAEWARSFLQDNYPCRVSMRKDPNAEKSEDGRTPKVFQILRHPDFEVIKRCYQDELAFGKHAREDLTTLYPDLEPADTARADLNANKKETARTMKAAGKTYAEIENATGMSSETIRKATADIEKPPKANTVKAQILNLLADGEEWKRKDIDAALTAAKQTVTAALKTLCERGTLKKPKHGTYRRKSIEMQAHRKQKPSTCTVTENSVGQGLHLQKFRGIPMHRCDAAMDISTYSDCARIRQFLADFETRPHSAHATSAERPIEPLQTAAQENSP